MSTVAQISEALDDSVPQMQDANGVPLIGLPPVEMIRVPVTLDPDARVRLYSR
jgi:hypothetical protein